MDFDENNKAEIGKLSHNSLYLKYNIYKFVWIFEMILPYDNQLNLWL